jgi:hypothetical protein
MPGLYTGATGLWGGFAGLLYGSSALSTPPGLLADAGGFTPASLFAAGEQGVWYDPSDFSTMFQDSAGTTPVTAVEQPVGRILDKSGRGNTATQATDASRPVLSARVNLLTYSEQFDNAAWVKSNATVTPDVIVAPNETLTADKLVEGVGTARKFISQSGATSGQTFSVYAQKGERDYVAIGQTNSGGIWAVSLFNINLGTYVGSYQAGGVSTPTNNTIISVGSGWYIVSCTLNIASGAQSPVIMVSNGGDPIFEGYTGNGTSGIYIWGADLRPTDQTTLLPAYQRIAAATDYDTTGFPYYLRFDGTDDSMATGTITPGIDKAQVFSGVRKLSDVSTGTVVQLSSSTSTNDGTLGLYAPFNSGAAADYAFISKGTVRITVVSAAFVGPESAVLTAIGDISGPTATLLRNGTQIATSSSSQGTGNFGSYALNLGTGAGLLNGNLYSLIVRFGANLDATTISNTETWVNGKTLAY